MNYKNSRPATLLDQVVGRGDNAEVNGSVAGIVVELIPAKDGQPDKVRLLRLRKIGNGPTGTAQYAAGEDMGPAANFIHADDALAATLTPFVAPALAAA